jgi:hypothetical protein
VPRTSAENLSASNAAFSWDMADGPASMESLNHVEALEPWSRAAPAESRTRGPEPRCKRRGLQPPTLDLERNSCCAPR